ncbi:lytic transglycosylase domain-containing protein [Sulfurovum sp. AR]|uniref:lytic transglycosylase domain-containing protein n=1 Tax=Sulfurovum sp. AR TaxID=1165841 RepID=UPI001EE65F14|nr:lytic transglycosylase domain-containing protein [Sulfurovum sp. AR]
MFCISSMYGVSLEHKYPSYTYVFHEFDIDESYHYNEEFISFVSKHEKKLQSFYRRSLLRGKEILPTMQGLLVEDGVSDLFIYLSMVESGFSTDAVSPKKAVGLWQFMPATAKEYNLTVCQSYDERCDMVSATSAAINYLHKLHNQFGKWYLSAMAYNCGEGCVSRAIKRAGTDELSVLIDGNLKYLPRETRQYMKKILLLAMIGENDTLDFSDNTDDKPGNLLIEVYVLAGTPLKEIAKLLNMKEEKLLKLNKSLKEGIVPKEKPTYKITIPIEKVYAFYLRYQLADKKKVFKSHMVSHTVALGETVESIAKLYNVDGEEIMSANHLKNDFLVLDSLLVIPVNKKTFDKIIK